MIYILLLILCAACVAFKLPAWTLLASGMAMLIWTVVDFVIVWRRIYLRIRHHDHLTPNTPRKARG